MKVDIFHLLNFFSSTSSSFFSPGMVVRLGSQKVNTQMPEDLGPFFFFFFFVTRIITGCMPKLT